VKGHRFFHFTVIILAIIMIAGAANAGGLKDRMLARIPVINELKSQGIVGEDNRGLLSYRTEQHPQEQVVNEENADRQTVYNAIARKQGVSTALVGSRRAQQIAGNALSGTWLQDNNGKWYQK